MKVMGKVRKSVSSQSHQWDYPLSQMLVVITTR